MILMGPVELTITFHLDEPCSEDIDEIVTIAREAINDKIGEIDYTTEYVTGFDISLELLDDG